MNQGRRLERLVRPLVPHLPRRQCAELIVDEGQQVGRSLRVPRTCFVQQLRHHRVGGRVWRIRFHRSRGV
jgi:hypothetical protein